MLLRWSFAVLGFVLGTVLLGSLLPACRRDRDRSGPSSCSPSVFRVIPSVGDTAGGERVTIVTACFRDDFTRDPPEVFFGPSRASGVSAVDAATLTVFTPSHPVAEAVDVEVRSTGISQMARLDGGFTYFLNPPPAACSVARVVPDWGSSDVPRTVVVEGSGFPVPPDPVPAIEFGPGNLGTSVVQLGPGTIQVDTPVVPFSGDVDVIVTPEGGGSCAGAVRYTFVDPPGGCVLDTVDPAFGAESGGSIVALRGSGFPPYVEVRFGGEIAPSMVPDPMTILATAPPGIGTVDVVVDLGGGIACDIPGGYRYVSCGGTPCAISDVDPSMGGIGEVVTIRGTSFEAGALVLFGEALARVIGENPPTEIVVEAPAPVGGSIVVDVQVVNPGGGCCTRADGYAYTPCVIDEVFPVSGGAAGGDTVTIWGSGFDSNVDVLFGQSFADPATITVNGAGTQITLLSPPEAGEGLRPVEVRNQLSGTTCLACCGFAYRQPTPDKICAVSNVNPASGPVAGGNLVSIHGMNFEPVGTCVFFGARCATVVSATSDQITVMAPPGSGPGVVDITVAHPDASPCVIFGGYSYN